MDSRSATELFHLLFLGHLSQRVAQNLFALKGGCNLRFYFKSIRYSEDIDIDVHTISVETLRSNVRQILKNKAFNDTLRSRNIEIVSSSEPKQTDTTQRFKVSLNLRDLGREIPTKIEFSRREWSSGVAIEPIDPDIIALHKLYPIHVFHYLREQAIHQKVGALIGRTQTQARDVFDLSLLIRAQTTVPLMDKSTTQLEVPSAVQSKILAKEETEKACEQALSLSFDDFKAQVVAYLMPQYQSYFDSQTVWNEMVSKVIESLRGDV